MKKKALAILLSILMLTSVTLPGTWATDETEETEDTVVVVTDEAETEAETDMPESETETDAPETEAETDVAESETETDVPESETETDAPEIETETETETSEPEPEEETFDPYAAVEYLYTLGSNEEIVAYLQSLTEDELSAVQAILEEWGMWADIAAMLYPEEAPEGMPPEDWGSTSLEGAVPFTNAVSMFSLIPTRESGSNNGDPGVVLNKTAKANADGGFDITLEAYATGAQTTENHADIVLVLDTSGSMVDGMTSDDYEIRYIQSDYVPGEYEKSYILQNGEYVVVMWTGGRWAIRNGNSFGNTVVPKSSANDSTQSRVPVYDGIDTSKYYYIRFEKDNTIEFQRVTYRTYNGETGWFTDANSGPKTPRTSSNSKEGSVFYQYQESVPFYQVKYEHSKLDALKYSVNTFIQSSLDTSPATNIAIVPFGGSVGSVTDFTNNANILREAVQGLSASGATNSGAAMSKAVDCINSLDPSHDAHKKIVIMFTDGEPTLTNGFNADVADDAIKASHNLKQDNVTVYTIGVFAGANGSLNSVGGASDVNKYMHYVSSNYPDATSMTIPGNQNPSLNGNSYYLSATNSNELNEIFQNISYVVGGATNENLGTSTVIKDIITPYFTVPADASDIKLYTANCTGGEGTSCTFGSSTERNDLTVSIDKGTATLNVSGFNFSENWCGKTASDAARGQKLIIEFTVSPKEGFLGGNDVPTNGDTSGMYLANGTEVARFDVPTVNVPIKDITITAEDKNVYLTQVPGDDDLKSDVKIKCGNVDITDPSKLEDWQKAYVTIEDWTVTPSTGFDATADGTYTVSAKVSPKTKGDSSKPGTVATEQSGIVTKAINVFKPELTYKDSEAYYGDNAPTSYDSNKDGDAAWKHGETLSTAVTMIGDKPNLTLSYTPESGKIVDSKIATKDDIPVAVTVKINGTDMTDNTTFVHTKCDANETDPTDGAFWLHVKTCSLTITKAAATGTTIGNDEYFVFNVKKDGNPYTQVTIQGTGSVTISELPVGTYTVTEDTSTAWRYNSAMTNGTATLSKSNASATVTCTNTIKNDHWLNHFARVINIFGKANGEKD